jgi:toxin ParE1/3/4
MLNIIFRQEAINDLNEIWLYTYETWSESQADIYYQLLKNAVCNISNNPIIGRAYQEIYTGLRGLKTGKHLIFYIQNDENNIEILRILHERMDVKSRFKPEQ